MCAALSLDAFTSSFIATALWQSEDEEGRHLDSRFGIEDLSPETMQFMVSECLNFQRKYAALLEAAYRDSVYHEGRAGHDYWLTRVGASSGFESRNLGHIGEELATAARLCGNISLYIGEDRKIHVENFVHCDRPFVLPET